MWATEIRSRHPSAVASKCSERGCGITVDVGKPHVLLKGEAIAGGPGCDCILFSGRDGLTVSLIELKSSSLDAGRIQAKFESSGNAALRMVGESARPDFFVVLAAKSYKRWLEYKKLQEATVMINRAPHRIRLRRCGERLSRIHADLASRADRKPAR